MSWFARGYGAARMGDVAKARESAKSLDDIRLKLASAQETYWSRQVEIQEIDVLAWTSLAEKNTDDALTRMRTAVTKEDATEKSVITPGPIAPARELLGEMLLQLNRPAEALKEFETTMAKEPNRFRALYGAARAAKLAGNQAAAKKYAAELLKICAKADQPGRTELAEVRAMAGAGGTGK
jgi:tetratricopeptide (TPR) repeat protein